jgi:hypothetical protein
MNWTKSSRCASGACVEVARTPAAVHVRDAAGATISLDPRDWAAFLRRVTR